MRVSTYRSRTGTFAQKARKGDFLSGSWNQFGTRFLKVFQWNLLKTFQFFFARAFGARDIFIVVLARAARKKKHSRARAIGMVFGDLNMWIQKYVLFDFVYLLDLFMERKWFKGCRMRL